MKILSIGNSTKFIKFITSIFPVTDISVLSWRSLSDYNNNSSCYPNKWDLILVAGYDYSISLLDYKEYIYRNVDCAYSVCKKYSNERSIIVYINTSKSRKNSTFSRYLYAKMLLGCMLSELPGKVYILEFPTILHSGKLSVIGGFVSKFLFGLVDKSGWLDKVEINKSKSDNLKIFHELNNKPLLPKPVLLKIPRTLLIDRLLRLTIG